MLRFTRSTRGRAIGARRFLVIAAAAATALAGGSSSLLRAQTTWIGTTGDWSDTANWNNGVPDDSVLAIISNGGTARVTDVEAAGELVLGSGTVDDSSSLTLGTLFDGFAQPGNFILEKGVCQVDEAYIGATDEDGNGSTADGSFLQLGGQHMVSSLLEIGTNTSVHGHYEIDAGSLTLATTNLNSSARIDVGSSVGSTFVQNGGIVGMTGSGSTTLAVNNGGTYQIGAGTLRLKSINIDTGGTFIQTGGTTSAPAGLINAGLYQITGGTLNASTTLAIGSTGSFLLSGTATVSAATNFTNSGSFMQTGGSMSSSTISSPAGSSYTLSSGTTQEQFGIDIRGKFQFDTSAALIVGGIGNLGLANFTNAGTNGAVTVQPNSVLILPPSVNPATRFTSLTNNGIVHNAGSQLVIPSGMAINGTGTIEDQVAVSGTLAATGGPINLSGGIVVPSGGSVNLGGGTLSVSDPSSSIGGTQFSAGTVQVGVSGAGSLSVTAGTTSVNTLNVGVGASGAVSITSPGTTTIPTVNVGVGAGGSVSITSAGTNITNLSVGHGASGSVVLNAPGTMTISSLSVGDLSPGSAYIGSGMGTLNVGFGNISVHGGSTLTQDGGTVNAGLALGDGLDGNLLSPVGVYQLNAGTLNTNTNTLVSGGRGSFVQNGGTANFTAVSTDFTFFGGSDFSYFLNGGSAIFNGLNIGSAGGASARFVQKGGTFNAVGIGVVQLQSGGTMEYGGGSFITQAFTVAANGTKTMIFDIDPTAPINPMTTGLTKIGGQLVIDLLDGAPAPSNSDTFTLIHARGSINGTFSNAANGSRIGTDGGTFRVNYGVGSAFAVTDLVLSDFQVPEPTGPTLMLGAIGIWLNRRKRIKSA